MNDFYLVVEMKDGKIVWSDNIVTRSKEHAIAKVNYYTKFGKGRTFDVLKVKQFSKLKI